MDENTLDTILHRITVLHQRSYKEDDASDTTFYVSRFYDHVSNMYRPTNLGSYIYSAAGFVHARS